MDLCEYEASLIYKESFRIGSKGTQKNPVSKKQNKEDKYEYYYGV